MRTLPMIRIKIKMDQRKRLTGFSDCFWAYEVISKNNIISCSAFWLQQN